MKISTTTSPGRAEKYYPPPLLRFLRSNVGSKSRGRTTSSRSSPLLFMNRRRSNGNAGSSSLEVQQEPTSPKVTCMGQVRVKRSARTGPKRLRRRWRRCKWVPPEKKLRPGCCVMKRPTWPKWRGGGGGGFLFWFSCTKKRRQEEEEDEDEKGSSRSEDVVEARSEGFEEEDEEEEEEEERRGRVSDVGFPRSVSPPKNALLLTRSRSAPYRSSSLACRFWGSPLEDRNGEEVTVAKQLEEGEEEGSRTSPTLERTSLSKEEERAEEEEAELSSTSPTSKRASLSEEEERDEKDEVSSTSPTSKRASLSNQEQEEEEKEANSTSPTSKRVSLSEIEEEEEASSSSPTSKRASSSKEEEGEEEEEASSSSPMSKRVSLSKEEERGSTGPTLKRSSLSKENVLEEEEDCTTSPTSAKEEDEEASLVGSVEEGLVEEEPMPEAVVAILTRCKSEPARTGVEKLGRRLGFT